MRKDDHLIFEAFAQQRLLSDEQAAKMIADKIRGTPNLNINTIKQYVSKYLGMVGKAPTDVDYLAAQVHDILSQQGVAGENAEGLSDQEYHKARKDSFELPGEEIGNGPIKVQLNKDTRLDCYKSGTVQGVRFSKGTIFNCDENVGDYYECDTEEYGGIAVFPDDVTVLSGEENAEDRSVQPGGSIEDITDAQKHSMNMLKQHGFHVNKVSNAHAEQMGGPVVYMGKKTGAMHQVAEVDPQGMINEETPEEYLANHVHAEDAETAEQRIMAAKQAVAQAKGQIAQAKTQGQMQHYGDGLVRALGKPAQTEDAEGTKQPYNAMMHLTQAANDIRDILKSHADDEARTEHIIKMAQLILGDKQDYTEAEYRKMLDGLIVILNRFIVTPMN